MSVRTGPDLAAELALARRLLAAEGQAVTALGARLDDHFHHAVGLIEACCLSGGTVLVTGLGKSGLIGAKISATLASLGVASHFVHPAEAAHGDLGRFRRSDVCVALSFSGETDEVVNLAAVLRQDEIPVIALTGGSGATSGGNGAAGGAAGGSSLRRLATVTLVIGTLEEEAEISPAPTLSTAASLALGDALAVCAAARLGHTPADFARRHPGGSLGGLLRPVTEALRFVVGKNLTPVPDDVSVAEALRLAEATVRRPGAVLLVARATGVLTGLFTDADLRRLIERDRAALDRPIADVMTRGPGTLSHASLVRDAVRMVREFRRDEVPVVDDAGRPVGLLDVQDLIAMRLVKE